MPDTTDIESVSLADIHATHTLFTDLTGDGVPELAANCGAEEVCRVYAGKPGQRLTEQLNNGVDAPADAQHPYGRPWSTIWLPNKLHDGWTGAGYSPLLPLGDATDDGINDLWTYSVPFIICYSTGVMLDSLIEAELDMRDNGGYIRGVVLGDIDGSGKKTYAMELGYHVLFFKPNEDIPTAGIYRQLPHPEGFRCEHAPAGVETARQEGTKTEHLKIIPNPAHGKVTLRWNALSDPATITLTTVDGRELRRIDVAPQSAEYAIATDALPSGQYFITLTSKDTTRTSTLLIP